MSRRSMLFPSPFPCYNLRTHVFDSVSPAGLEGCGTSRMGHAGPAVGSGRLLQRESADPALTRYPAPTAWGWGSGFGRATPQRVMLRSGDTLDDHVGELDAGGAIRRVLGRDAGHAAGAERVGRRAEIGPVQEEPVVIPLHDDLDGVPVAAGSAGREWCRERRGGGDT